MIWYGYVWNKHMRHIKWERGVGERGGQNSIEKVSNIFWMAPATDGPDIWRPLILSLRTTAPSRATSWRARWRWPRSRRRNETDVVWWTTKLSTLVYVNVTCRWKDDLPIERHYWMKFIARSTVFWSQLYCESRLMWSLLSVSSVLITLTEW